PAPTPPSTRTDRTTAAIFLGIESPSRGSAEVEPGKRHYNFRHRNPAGPVVHSHCPESRRLTHARHLALRLPRRLRPVPRRPVARPPRRPAAPRRHARGRGPRPRHDGHRRRELLARPAREAGTPEGGRRTRREESAGPGR